MAEDRFFGISDAGGILAIRLDNMSTNGWKIDRLQYGAMVPEASRSCWPRFD